MHNDALSDLILTFGNERSEVSVDFICHQIKIKIIHSGQMQENHYSSINKIINKFRVDTIIGTGYFLSHCFVQSKNTFLLVAYDNSITAVLFHNVYY